MENSTLGKQTEECITQIEKINKKDITWGKDKMQKDFLNFSNPTKILRGLASAAVHQQDNTLKYTIYKMDPKSLD